MATGPEHYQESERLLALVDKLLNGAREGNGPSTANLIAAAAAHATLALAAATALPLSGEMPIADADAWRSIAGDGPQRAEEPHYRHKTLPRWEDRSGLCVKCGADAADGSCTVPDEPEAAPRS